MAAMSPATRLVTRAARQVLQPMGLGQKGRSRTWIDDHRWWLIVVEFQPSGFTQGTYLNVGVNWLWWAKAYLSFDYGSRVRWTTTTDPIRLADGDLHTTDFVAYRDERQFDHEVRAVCHVAAQRVVELRKNFTDLRSTARTLNEHATTDQSWPSYHAGVAAGLAGDTATAQRLLTSVAIGQATSSWQAELIAHARDLSELLGDRSAFVARITSIVVRARALLKLEPALPSPGIDDGHRDPLEQPLRELPAEDRRQHLQREGGKEVEVNTDF